MWNAGAPARIFCLSPRLIFKEFTVAYLRTTASALPG